MTEKLDYFDEDRPEHLLSKIVDITGMLILFNNFPQINFDSYLHF